MASSTQSESVVFTPMYPQESGHTAPAYGNTPHVSSALGKVLKGDPKALGTVQIMIGVLYVLFGIAMTICVKYINPHVLFGFCGGLIYISSGALSVAVNNKLNRCLVNGALGMNIISTITAGITIICLCQIIDDSGPNSYDILEAMLGVLLVFSILEFVISICMSAFACRVVYGCSTEQVVYMPPTSNQVASENLLIPAPNSCQTTPNYTHNPTVMGSMQTARPPQYEFHP